MRRSAAIAVVALSLALMSPSAAAQSATVPSTVHRAVLAGELGFEGGPYPGGFHPTSGSVEVEFYSLPLVLDEPVGSSGHFRITLAPGRYTVIGCGPSASPGSHDPCSKPKNLTVTSGEVRHIRLVWAFAP
jgi:hypothetical protein